MYFPQFYDFEKTKDFWGQGFTDFTNVQRIATNVYGQPIIKPSERMGFYDITSPTQRRFQGELAQKYGILGFVIYH